MSNGKTPYSSHCARVRPTQAPGNVFSRLIEFTQKLFPPQVFDASWLDYAHLNYCVLLQIWRNLHTYSIRLIQLQIIQGPAENLRTSNWQCLNSFAKTDVDKFVTTRVWCKVQTRHINTYKKSETRNCNNDYEEFRNQLFKNRYRVIHRNDCNNNYARSWNRLFKNLHRIFTYKNSVRILHSENETLQIVVVPLEAAKTLWPWPPLWRS